MLGGKDTSKLTHDEKVALMGKPMVSETSRIQIRIRESKEFKVIHCYLLEIACLLEECRRSTFKIELL